MSKHVATPVRVPNIASGFEIDDALGRPLAQVFERYSKSNDERREVCAHIVRCVNSFDALVEALEAAECLIREALPKFNWGASALDANAIRLLNEVPATVRAALSAARSEP